MENHPVARRVYRVSVIFGLVLAPLVIGSEAYLIISSPTRIYTYLSLLQVIVVLPIMLRLIYADKGVPSPVKKRLFGLIGVLATVDGVEIYMLASNMLTILVGAAIVFEEAVFFIYTRGTLKNTQLMAPNSSAVD